MNVLSKRQKSKWIRVWVDALCGLSVSTYMVQYIYPDKQRIEYKGPSAMSAKPDSKILERIRALLAMGGDVSSEHEAAIALKRARSLMDKHQVTLSDIESINDDSFGLAEHETGSRQQKTWVSGLAIRISKLNDCIVKIKTRDDGNISYVFHGFAEDSQVCDFMLIYLVDTCNRLYLRDKAKLGLKGVADKNDFLIGMVTCLGERMDEMMAERRQEQASDGRSLVLVKKAMVERQYGEAKYKTVRMREANRGVFEAGRSAANDIHLGSFVGDKTKPRMAVT